jgi:hypothetical protein
MQQENKLEYLFLASLSALSLIFEVQAKKAYHREKGSPAYQTLKVVLYCLQVSKPSNLIT